MAKAKTIEQLEQLARDYGVQDNPIVKELVAKYWEQKSLIKKIQTQINKDGLTCKKEYVKGRENIVANPLLDVIQKHQDSSSRTLDSLTNAITKFGTPPSKKNRLHQMMSEDDG